MTNDVECHFMSLLDICVNFCEVSIYWVFYFFATDWYSRYELFVVFKYWKYVGTLCVWHFTVFVSIVSIF